MTTPHRQAQVMSLPSLPRSVSRLRRFAVDVCQECGFGDACDTLALLVSEVATNALLHGSGDVRLQVVATGGRLRVEVADDSDRLPVPRGADLDAEGGRGLALVEQLSDDWGVIATRPSGKIVWFELSA